MRKFIYGALVAMVLVACAKEEASIAKIEEVKNPYAVTTDEAVELLQTVIGGESTRAISVGEIKTLRKSDFVPTTRGADDGDLIYIVDLENGGSAIMGADKRMEPIYAILDETKVSPEQLTLTATRSDDGEQDIKEYVMGLVNAKIGADASVLAFPEMPIVPRPQIITITVSLGSKAPLLETKWGWVAPYNSLVGGTNLDNGVITLAQLFYYFRQPNSLNGHSFDWDLIAQCEYGSEPSFAAQTEVAEFVYEIVQNGADCDGMMEYDIRQAIIRGGFNPTYFYAYGPNMHSQIKSQIDLNKLVVASGMISSNNVRYWLFDGYKFYREDVYLREYDPMGSGLYTETLQSSTTYNLCHCNFGYGGVCDGYYPTNVFDLTVRLNSKNIDSLNGDIAGTQEGVYMNSNLNISILQ